MSLPARYTGLASIYGVGSNVGLTGIEITDTSQYRFGTIDAIDPFLPYSVGDSVLFPYRANKGVYIYGGQNFTLIPVTEIIFAETPTPPEEMP